MKKSITVGSDYSGVGAFDQALISLGLNYKIEYSCDMDKYARKSFIHNYGTKRDIEIVDSKEHDYMCDTMLKIVDGKIKKDFDLKKFYEESEKLSRKFSFYYPANVYNREIPKKPIDIYMTSPPCQGFSIAGKRKGSILFLNSLEFIRENNPRFFIFENVKGLLSHEKSNKKSKYGKTFSMWLNYLGGKSINGNVSVFPYPESVPYHIYYTVLNAKHFGIPQNRERVFIIGIRDDKDNTFSFPSKKNLSITLKDVLQSNVDKKYFLSKNMVKNLIKYNDRQEKNGNGFMAKFRDIETTEVMCTLKVGGGGKDDLIKIGFINQDTQASQVYDDSGISPTLSAGTHGYANGYIQENNIKRAGKIEGVKHDQNSRVYDTSGISATIQTMQGGDRQPKILLTEDYKQLSRRRTEEGKEKRRQSMANDGIDYSSFKDREFFISNDGEIANTITTAQTKDNLITNFHLIRRLTPRECFRLMGFPDTFKIIVSDTQAYKQAGNSIVKNVLAAIILKLNL